MDRIFISDQIAGREILQGLSEGKTIKMIAHEKKLKRRSLEDVVMRLKKNYECQSTYQLIAMFLKVGLIKGPEINSMQPA